MIIDERMATYIDSLDRGNTPFLDEIEKYALETQVPVIRKSMQSLLKFLLAFSYTAYQEMDADGNLTGVSVFGPKHVTKWGMYSFCWPGCLTVMYDREKVGLIQIEDIKKNNDYAMWLKLCKKTDCYLLDECLAKYRRGRAGSVSSHGIKTMMRWHYKLWREAEGKNALASLWHTSVNLVCGLYKKLHYVRRFSVLFKVYGHG